MYNQYWFFYLIYIIGTTNRIPPNYYIYTPVTVHADSQGTRHEVTVSLTNDVV
jgi:hypothetical protein